VHLPQQHIQATSSKHKGAERQLGESTALHMQSQRHSHAQLRYTRLCLNPITHLRRRRCWLLPAGPMLVAPPGWLPA
jgi:hypothetical protein